MAELSIQVGKYYLDLSEDAVNDFYITKQIHDLRDLETRNASFSKRLTIPRTLNNLQALRTLVVSVARDTNVPYRFLDCDVRLSGYPVIDAQIMLISEDRRGNTLSVQLFDRVINFYDRLSDDSIQDLDWNTETFEWSLTAVEPYLNTTQGLLFGRSIWFKNDNWRFAVENNITPSIQINDTDLNYTGCWYYVKTLMQKIFATTGIDVDLGDLANIDTYDKLVLAVPTTQLLENFKATVDTIGVGNQTGYTVNNATPNTDYQIPFNSIKQNNPPGIVTGNTYVAPVSGYFDLSWNIGGVMLDNIGVWGAGVKLNGSVIAFTSSLIKNGLVGRYSDSRTLFLNAGDVITFFHRSPSSFVGGLGQSIGIDMVSELSGAGTVNTRLVDFATYVPEISQRDFVKEIFKLYHIVVLPTDDGVTFKIWDDLDAKEYTDLTPYHDTDKGFDMTGYVPSYGQTNVIQYTKDDLLERVDIGVEFPQNNEILPPKKVKVQSKFGMSDTALSDNNNSISVPAFDLTYINSAGKDITVANGTNTFTVEEGGPELQVGDELFVKNTAGDGLQGRRIVTGINGNQGTVDVNWSQPSIFPFEAFRYEVSSGLGIRFGVVTGEQTGVTVRDGGNAITDKTQKVVNFTGDINWPQLTSLYYSTLINMMEKPTTVRTWFRLPPLIFTELNFLQPIYFKNKTYYLNKIEQWSPSKFCRCELIELKGVVEPIEIKNFAVNPNPLSFGSVAKSSTKNLKTQIYNRGSEDLEFNLSAITGANASLFSFVNPPSNPFTIPGRTFIDVEIQVSTGTSVGDFVAQFDVQPTDASLNDITVNLQATVSAVIDYTVAPNPLAFGSVEINNSVDLVTTVQNTGDVAIQFERINPSGAFSFVGGSQFFTLNPTETENITVRFTPVDEGPQAGSFVVQTVVPNTFDTSVVLNGTGLVPSYFIDPIFLNFGQVAQGGTPILPITITNDGDIPLTFDWSSGITGPQAGNFELVTPGTTNITIQPNNNHVIQVRFLANAPKSVKNAELFIDCTNSQTAGTNIDLQGETV